MQKIALAVAAATTIGLMSIASPAAAQSLVDPATAVDCADSSDCALIMVARRPDGGWIMLPPGSIDASGPRYTNMARGIEPAYGEDIRYTNLGDVEAAPIIAPDTDLACVDASNCGYVLAVTGRGVELMPRYWTRY